MHNLFYVIKCCTYISSIPICVELMLLNSNKKESCMNEIVDKISLKNLYSKLNLTVSTEESPHYLVSLDSSSYKLKLIHKEV